MPKYMKPRGSMTSRKTKMAKRKKSAPASKRKRCK
jgi:hypothetical protein